MEEPFDPGSEGVDQRPDSPPLDSPPVPGVPDQTRPTDPDSEPDTGDYPPAEQGTPDTAAPPD